VTKKLITGLSAIVLLVSGIGLSVHILSRPAWNVAAPTVGKCWVGMASAVVQTDAGGLHEVSCSSPHSNQTVAVIRLPKTITVYPISNGLQLSTRHELNAAVIDAAIKSFFGTLSMEQIFATRVAVHSYLPTLQQWNRGARWLRLDSYLLKVGSPIGLREPDLTLKGRIQSLIVAAKNNLDLINLCVDSASNTEIPRGANAKGVVADCTKNPRWHIAVMTNLAKRMNEPFPGVAEVSARSKSVCERYLGPGVYAIAYYGQTPGEVSRQNWTGKGLYAACWVSNKP